MLKRKIMLVVFFALCLLHTVYIGAAGILPYDPWSDINDDGIIDVEDLSDVSLRLWEEGTPINKAAVQFEGNISVPAAALVPLRYDATNYSYMWIWGMDWGFGLWHFGGNILSFVGAVQLPQGATLTNVTFYWCDWDVEDIIFRLYAANGTHYLEMAYCTSSGAAGWGSSYDDTINNATIDNYQWSYVLALVIPGSFSSTYETYVFSFAVIEYEY